MMQEHKHPEPVKARPQATPTQPEPLSGSFLNICLPLFYILSQKYEMIFLITNKSAFLTNQNV